MTDDETMAHSMERPFAEDLQSSYSGVASSSGLSPIPEGDNESDAASSTALHAQSDDVTEDLEEELGFTVEQYLSYDSNSHKCPDASYCTYLQRPLYHAAEGALFDVSAHYTLASTSSSTYGTLEEYDQHNRPCVDLWFIDGFGKVVMDNTHAEPDEVVVTQMSSERTTALRREADIIDKTAQRVHSQVCEVSVLEEFRT